MTQVYMYHIKHNSVTKPGGDQKRPNYCDIILDYFLLDISTKCTLFENKVVFLKLFLVFNHKSK